MNISDFLESVYHLLPPESYFLGCYIDSKIQNVSSGEIQTTASNNSGWVDTIKYRIRTVKSIINRVYKMIDLRSDRFLSKRKVILYLEKAGLKIIDITQFQHLTYFCTQKTGAA
jgi:hypothetical protein